MSFVVPALCAVTLIALTVSFIRSTEPKIGAAVSAAVSVLLLFLLADKGAAVKSALSGVAGGRLAEYSPYILKSVCIGFFTQTAYDVCSDSGERGIASKVLTAGKLGILAVCLPLIKALLDTALGYIQ